MRRFIVRELARTGLWEVRDGETGEYIFDRLSMRAALSIARKLNEVARLVEAERAIDGANEEEVSHG